MECFIFQNDGFHGTGCHDVVCPGFVQVSSEIPVGTPIGPLSIIHGQQYSLDTYIYLVKLFFYLLFFLLLYKFFFDKYV